MRLIDGDSVVIIDSVTLPSEHLDQWLESWGRDYRPGAEERGLRLWGLWLGSSELPEESVVVICWSTPRPGRFWAARWAATEDPQVLDFWTATDAMARARDRRVLQNAAIV